MPKIKIDLTAKAIEIEGSEKFVQDVYAQVRDQLFPVEKSTSAPPAPVRREPVRKETYALLPDLDLSGQGHARGLSGFFAEKSPKNGMQKNTVFVYYLARILAVEKIGLNHLYTCYKVLGQKPPAAMRQSILDTSFRKGWLDTKSLDDILLTMHGENLVEHELPAV